MSDTYQHWVERIVGGRDAKPLHNGEIVKSSSGTPFGVIEFARIVKSNFVANLGKKGDKYIYHFYPLDKYHPSFNGSIVSQTIVNGTTFYGALSKVFLELFKREDQIEADWVPEMKAWAVRVSGWADNVWGDDLAVRAIHRLDEVLTGGSDD